MPPDATQSLERALSPLAKRCAAHGGITLQPQRFAVFIRECANDLFQCALELSRHQLVFLRRRDVNDRCHVNALRHLTPALRAAPMGHHFVAGDSERPRKTVAAAVEVSDPRADSVEDLLRNILSIGDVAEPTLREREDHWPQLINENVEGCSISVGELNHGFVNRFPVRGIHACSPDPQAVGHATVGGYRPSVTEKHRRPASRRPSRCLLSARDSSRAAQGIGKMASSPQISAPSLTKRRIGAAAVAAFIGCAACCAMPLLAAAGLSGGVASVLSAVFRPGNELLVGGGVFVLALGATALWIRLKGRGDTGCGSTCKLDGRCCERGTARSAT